MTAVSLVLLAVALASAEPRPVLWLAGNDATVWVVEPRTAGSRNTVRIYYGDTLAPGVLTSPTLPDRIGEVVGLAVNDAAALLLYSDLTTTLLTIRSDAVGPNWPGSAAPLALTGDATRPDIYGIGDGAEMELPVPTPPHPAPTTGPRGRASRTRHPATTRPAPGLALFRMRGRLWERVAALPEPARSAEQYWLSARDGGVHLFWRAEGAGPISCCTFVEDAWGTAHAVPESAGATAWASCDRIGPVMALLRRTDDSAAGGALRVAWRKDDEWHVSQPLADGAGELRLDPGQCAAGVARGKLAIARIGTDGKIELGESALNGDRTVVWQPAVLIGGGPLPRGASERTGWLEMLAMLVVMGVIVWSRQEMLTRPLALPRTLALAHPGVRLAAGAIDLIPPVLLTAPLWVPPLSEFAVLAPRLLEEPALAQGLMAARVAPPWHLVVGVYAGYCALFEWLWGTTPGKRLLGCRVIGGSGERPTVQQVLVRNAVRLPELGILLVAASSAFLLLAISRNRQRIGDVVAATFVVRAMPPLARPAGAARTGEESREEEKEEVGV